MSNDNKTLADAQPGGRVRLGDHPKDGEVLVEVSGLTGSGKSAIAGEIEILCKALGLDAEWVNGDEEKRLTHADWIGALEMYKPKVVIVEKNIPRAALSAQPSPADTGIPTSPSPGGQDALADALVPVADEWYRLCERRFAVDRISISGQLAEAIMEAVCAARQPVTMDDALAAGDGTLHGAIDHWQERALRAEAELAARQPVGEPEIWVSPGQLEERKRRPAGQGSNYLPTRLACEGNFTQPLYAAPTAQQPAQVYLDGLDRALGEAIDQRDRYHEMADDLAGHIAAITGVDIGEHSSANCPWQNAIEAAEEYKPAQAVDLPYSLDADPAGIRARVCDVITGTLMIGAQGHTPPPAGHWAEPFWQAARADATAQAVDLGQPDPTLLHFYQVADFPSLVTALEAHVLQLIDLHKRSVKPWEDTMPPTLLPKWVRENSPVLAKDLLALAEKWQDEAAATWGESPAHAAKQQCCDELRALIDSQAVGK